MADAEILQVRYFSVGYSIGMALMACGVVAPLVWVAFKRKFTKSGWSKGY